MTFGASLQNGTALVVGATQGIGLGFVNYLLADARIRRVYGTYRNPDSARALMTLESHGNGLSCLPMEVTDEASIASAVDNIQHQSDRLDMVIYCVGLLHDGNFQPEKSLRQLEADQLLRSFQVNAIGAGLLAKHVLPLLKHESPSVLAAISAKIGSIGDNRLGGWYGYRASKAALNMLLKTASVEYARKSPNTVIALLHPGTTDTRLSKPFQRGVPQEKLFPVERTVSQLMAVIDRLETSDSGEFFNWNGERLPW